MPISQTEGYLENPEYRFLEEPKVLNLVKHQSFPVSIVKEIKRLMSFQKAKTYLEPTQVSTMEL